MRTALSSMDDVYLWIYPLSVMWVEGNYRFVLCQSIPLSVSLASRQIYTLFDNAYRSSFDTWYIALSQVQIHWFFAVLTRMLFCKFLIFFGYSYRYSFEINIYCFTITWPTLSSKLFFFFLSIILLGYALDLKNTEFQFS
jgi:hypothetical protein